MYLGQKTRKFGKNRKKITSATRKKRSAEWLGTTKNCSYGTGSYPLPPHGWQREIRFNVNQNPLKTPYFRNASIPYCEHDGVKRQLFGKNGEIVY